MLNSTSELINALQGSKQVLFVMHEYLPLPLALWVPSLVSLLKKQGKDIAVLVSQDVFGWQKRIDEIYPTDMVLALEQLRQVISIPVVNKSESVGDVSYRVTDGSLEITVVPVKETLDTENIKAITKGKIYETIVGVGISASHPILNVLRSSQASLSQSKAFFVGTYAVQGALTEKLSFIPSLTVLDKDEDKFLRETLQQISGEKELEASQRELVTLFVQSIVASAQQFEYLDKEGYEYLGKIADGDMDSGRMASLYSGDFAQQNRILQQILQSAKKSTHGEMLLFTVTAEQVGLLETSVQDILTALYYLPKYPQVKQIIVVIQENGTRHHVYMNGQPDVVRQVAMKYGFPRTERLTGGFIEGVNFEKLCQDITRVVGKEELTPVSPNTAVSQPEIVKVEDSIQPLTTAQQPAKISESPSIPNTPSLDEVLANSVERNLEEREFDSGEDIDMPNASQSEVILQSSVLPVEIPVQTSAIPTSTTPSGLDFAAIARKMRESAP
ncbi:hypothetical protein IT418_03875 [bacterium]|nr:hypothetical protein [bacterium]